MKKWVAPELYELKAQWTQNAVLTDGVDAYAETGKLTDGTIVELGSCC